MLSDCEDCKHTYVWKLIDLGSILIYISRSLYYSCKTQSRYGWSESNPQRNDLNVEAHRFFVELEGSKSRNDEIRQRTIKLYRRPANDSQRADSGDEYNHACFHEACMVGDVERVERFIREGVDVDLDTWKCSPLYIAARFRRADVVKLLLDKGADPNRPDHELSTPLHALARPCLCECGTKYNLCDHRKPAREIVIMLAERGADIEARDKCGDTPLSLALRRFDVELAKALLERGASLDILQERDLFSWNFAKLELKNYPLTLNIVETMRLLRSVDYETSLGTRLGMLKCWKRLRGNDALHSIPSGAELEKRSVTCREAVYQIYIYERFGFFRRQEAVDYLLEKKKVLVLSVPNQIQGFQPCPEMINSWELQVAKLNDIKINDDVSLYEICQMSYDRGYAIFKNANYWRVPSLDGLEHSRVNLIVKRHLANVLIRQHLELAVADIFTTDYCQLNLPYLVCKKIAEKMSDEDLFRLCERADEENLGLPETSRHVYKENVLRGFCLFCRTKRDKHPLIAYSLIIFVYLMRTLVALIEGWVMTFIIWACIVYGYAVLITCTGLTSIAPDRIDTFFWELIF